MVIIPISMEAFNAIKFVILSLVLIPALELIATFCFERCASVELRKFGETRIRYSSLGIFSLHGFHNGTLLGKCALALISLAFLAGALSLEYGFGSTEVFTFETMEVFPMRPTFEAVMEKGLNANSSHKVWDGFKALSATDYASQYYTICNPNPRIDARSVNISTSNTMLLLMFVTAPVSKTHVAISAKNRIPVCVKRQNLPSLKGRKVEIGGFGTRTGEIAFANSWVENYEGKPPGNFAYTAEKAILREIIKVMNTPARFSVEGFNLVLTMSDTITCVSGSWYYNHWMCAVVNKDGKIPELTRDHVYIVGYESSKQDLRRLSRIYLKYKVDKQMGDLICERVDVHSKRGKSPCALNMSILFFLSGHELNFFELKGPGELLTIAMLLSHGRRANGVVMMPTKAFQIMNASRITQDVAIRPVARKLAATGLGVLLTLGILLLLVGLVASAYHFTKSKVPAAMQQARAVDIIFPFRFRPGGDFAISINRDWIRNVEANPFEISSHLAKPYSVEMIDQAKSKIRLRMTLPTNYTA